MARSLYSSAWSMASQPSISSTMGSTAASALGPAPRARAEASSKHSTAGATPIVQAPRRDRIVVQGSRLRGRSQAAGFAHAAESPTVRVAPQVLLCQLAGARGLAGNLRCFDLARQCVFGKRARGSELACEGECIGGFRRLPDLTEIDPTERERGQRRGGALRVFTGDTLEKTRGLRGMIGEARGVGRQHQIFGRVAHDLRGALQDRVSLTVLGAPCVIQKATP